MGSLPELVSIVPHLLGFVPDDSAVAVGVRGGRVDWALRSDLPASETQTSAWWANVRRAQVRERPDRVIVLLFCAHPADAERQVDTLAQPPALACELAVVCGDQVWWWDDEVRYDEIPAGSAAAVTLIAEGIAPHASRADRIASVECAESLVARAVQVEQERLVRVGLEPASAADAWTAVIGCPGTAPLPGTADLALVTGSLARVGCRDAVIGALVPSLWCPVPADDTVALAVAERSRSHLNEATLADIAVAMHRVVRTVDGPSAAGLLAASAAVTWAVGDSVVAEALSRRTLRVAPGHSLAGLVLQAARLGFRPGA